MKRKSSNSHEGGDSKAKRIGEHHGGSFRVYMEHKVAKLRMSSTEAVGAMNATGRSASSDGCSTNRIFRGVHVYVNGYTKPPIQEIKRLILLHGGGFEHYHTPLVTHMVASNLPESKIQELMRSVP